VSGGLRAILEAIAKAAGVGHGRNSSALMDVLERSFDYRHTLIFDEVARLLPGRSANLAALEFIRRLHDVSGCGIVLVSTEVFGREMRSGRLSDWFEQLLGRIEVPLQIPFKVSRQEVAEICDSFCGDREPSPDLVKLGREIANGPGRIRLLFTLLRHAAMLARKKKEALNAAHLQAAKDFRENVNRWPED
jgi:DNA transposition AAA+ family ATPase